MSALASCPVTSKRLKYAVALRRSRVDGAQDDRPYIGLENIESSTGRLIGDPAATEQSGPSATRDAESLSNTFEPGDVLFGKLRPYLAKAWVAAFPGRCTTELLVMQPVENESRFLRYVCLSRDFIDAVDASTFGSKMPRADWDFIGNMPIPVPPLPQQRVIADYLDRETARLDALVAAKERVLGLLAEKRRALITRAVTRGLDPSAPFRDSGIPWLGEIPAHWRVAGSTKYLRSLVDYRGATPEKTRSGTFLLTARNVRSGYIDYECSEEFVDTDDIGAIMRRGAPALGDILFTTEAPLGQAALVDRVDVALAQRVIKLDYHPSVLLNAFALRWILSTPFQYQLGTLATGSTALGIKGERLHMLRNLIPPVHEQVDIVEYISREAAKLDDVCIATERTIALLKERRAALIAAAVTGQCDVRARA